MSEAADATFPKTMTAIVDPAAIIDTRLIAVEREGMKNTPG